jgi:hypothetical protein
MRKIRNKDEISSFTGEPGMFFNKRGYLVSGDFGDAHDMGGTNCLVVYVTTGSDFDSMLEDRLNPCDVHLLYEILDSWHLDRCEVRRLREIKQLHQGEKILLTQETTEALELVE